MNALDNLLSQPVRENAGQRTGNRFQYQYHWGLIKLLELFESTDDFMMIFEFADDIIVLDSTDNPKYIDFYQIKTNSKKNAFNWTRAALLKRGTKKNPTLSIVEKMIDNYIRYTDNTRNIQFVSNLHCKFKDISTKEQNPLVLKSLANDDIEELKKQMCTNCPQKNSCNEQCKKIISFSCANLDLSAFKETSIGKVNVFLNKLYPGSDINGYTLYDVLITKIKDKSTYEGQITNKKDLAIHKSISKQNFQEQLSAIYKSSELKKMYATLHTDISKIYSIPEAKIIQMALKKIETDILDIDNFLLQKVVGLIKKDVNDIIKNNLVNNDDELKEHINCIINQIYESDNTIQDIYDKYYISALFFREWSLYEQVRN